MRPLTPKERTLSLLLLALVFIAGNLIALPWLQKQQKQLTARISELRSQQEVATTWLGEKDLWTERKTWLDANQPKLTNSGDASSDLLKLLQESARQNKIKIVDQKLLEPQSLPGYQAIAVRMSVNGNMEAIARWLSAIEQPNLFHAVPKFNLKREGDNMRCDLDLARWYAP